MDLKGCIMKPAGLLLSVSSAHPIIGRSSFIYWRKANFRKVPPVNDKELGRNHRDHAAFIRVQMKTDYREASYAPVNYQDCLSFVLYYGQLNNPASSTILSSHMFRIWMSD
jgi:hypothetical protein